jgi:hypothetical protein
MQTPNGGLVQFTIQKNNLWIYTNLNQKVKQLTKILNEGADPNYIWNISASGTDWESYRTPLTYMFRDGHWHDQVLCLILLKYGANPNKHREGGRILFHNPRAIKMFNLTNAFVWLVSRCSLLPIDLIKLLRKYIN